MPRRTGGSFIVAPTGGSRGGSTTGAVQDPVGSLRGKRVVFLSWRDTRHPEGGGAELYLEQVAEGLVELGAEVTVLSADHAGAPPEETLHGVRHVHRGGKLGVYPAGLRALRRGDLGRADLVVDVQNGMPFLSRWVTRAPVVVLVHHVHREQWPVVYPGASGTIGWWIESRLAPWVYRGCQYVTVSAASRDELRDLGVGGSRIAVVHNGTAAVGGAQLARSSRPTVAVVGRLVPHKQVEHAVDAVLAMRSQVPDVLLRIVGSGWWEEELRTYVRNRGAEDLVVFEGHVDEARKQQVYAQAWVLALPSLKEGWGLVVGEAAMWGTPTIAYRTAGGTRESVLDGESGILVDSQDEFHEQLADILTDADLRARLGTGARTHSHRFTWERTRRSFATVLGEVLAGHRVDGQDPVAPPGSSRDASRRRRR